MFFELFSINLNGAAPDVRAPRQAIALTSVRARTGPFRGHNDRYIQRTGNRRVNFT